MARSRYPKITPAEWAEIRRGVLRLVTKRAGDALGPPEDIVAEAIRRAEEASAREWNPEERSLASHIGSFANSLIANAWRKKERATTSSVDKGVIEGLPDQGDTPEASVARAQEKARNAKLLAELRSELAHDACCIALLDGLQQDDTKPFKRAIALGFSHQNIEDARQKIRRHGEKILERARRAARAKGK